MLIIGSKALKKYSKSRECKNDLDLIGSRIELSDTINFIKKNFKVTEIYPTKFGYVIKFLRKQKLQIIEFELIEKRPSSKLIIELENAGNETIKFASLETLYLLKMSHRYLKNSPHFLKTMNDIHLIRIIKDGNKIKINEDILKLREKETYDYSLPNLKTDKDSFFKKNESFYVYDHDSIHEAIKIEEVPAYTRFIKDKAEVFTDKEKFNSLPFYQKLNAVIEESMVLALERSLIPNNFKIPRDKAFKMALEKVCTSITSGYFREFAWETYHDSINVFNSDSKYSDYDLKFLKALGENKIKYFKK
jgi:hypothetical protein